MNKLSACCYLVLLWAQAAAAYPDCPTCVEDVVVETLDGEWIAGYIYWSRSPFRYLDLHDSSDQRRLAQEAGPLAELRIWQHAASISRDRVPEEWGEPPPVPPPPPGYRSYFRRAEEVALLIDEPLEIHRGSIRRIYPRIGSGLTSLRVTSDQMLRMARDHLPLIPSDTRMSCPGCPAVAEDVTIRLRSGAWVSGLVQWHVFHGRLAGYDSQELERQKVSFPFLRQGEGDELVLWPEAISAPRRVFHSHGKKTDQGFEQQSGFLRIPGSVLLVASASVIPLSEIALVLPGPSDSEYPLSLNRRDSRKLLLATPTWAIHDLEDEQGLYCFAYGSTVSLKNLAAACDQKTVWEHRGTVVPNRPAIRIARQPVESLEIPTAPEAETILLVYFDWGT